MQDRQDSDDLFQDTMSSHAGISLHKNTQTEGTLAAREIYVLDIEARVQETVARILSQQGISATGSGTGVHNKMGNRCPSNHDSPFQAGTRGKESEQVVIVKEEKVKVTELKELTTGAIRAFLHELEEAEKLGQIVSVSSHIKEKALELIMCECPGLSNEEIKSFLKHQYDKDMDELREQPIALIRSKVKWNDDDDKSNEEKARTFLQDLTVQLHYVGEEATLGTLNRERIMQEVVKQLPAGLEITPEDVISNQRYQTVDGLEQLIENRLALLNKKSCRMNRTASENESNDLLNRVIRLEHTGPKSLEHFSGYCWNCGQRGHRAEECSIPETEQFQKKLEEYREYKRQNRLVATEQSQKCQLEMRPHDGNWVQIKGCLDSGAVGNVAPLNLMHEAYNVMPLSGYTYRLPNQEEVHPEYKGTLTVRVQIDGQAVELGDIPFHFLEHPLWDQVLVGRPTLQKMKLLPEQNIRRLTNQE